MTSYFFHTTLSGPAINHVEATEFADDQAAWDEATRACGEMMTDIDGSLAISTDWTTEVHDDQGLLFRITFGAKQRR